MTIHPHLLTLARPWLEAQLGFPLPNAAPAPVIHPAPDLPGAHPFFAVRADNVTAIAARADWLDDIRRIADDLHPDLLFSTFGPYELSRVTLPNGYAIWNPVPNYLADSSTWRPVHDDRPTRLTPTQLETVDWRIFWHCPSKPSAAFGIHEANRLVALATASDRGHRIYEIGVDVAPDAKSRGLGRAVVSAAGNWILQQGATIHATAGAWNIPSTRTLRSLGLQYTYTTLICRPAPFKVPPQPLGTPLPGAEVHDLYPRWAHNQDIHRHP